MTRMQQIREVITTRDGFLKYSVIVVGGPVSLMMFSIFVIEGAPGFAVIFAAVGLGVGYLWGIMFWEVAGKSGAERYHALKAKRLGTPGSDDPVKTNG